MSWLARLLGRASAPATPAPAAAPSIPVAAIGDPPAPQQAAAPRPSLLMARDRERLRGVHPDLVRVVEAARLEVGFFVVEGLRTLERQRQLLAMGKTRTLNSRHLTGHAVDLCPWQDLDGDGVVDNHEIDWNDVEGFRRVAQAMQRAADAQGVRIRWGGTFTGFFDGPHFELDARAYPAP